MLALPSSIVSRVSRSVCGGRPFAAPLRQLPSHPQALKLVRRLCADAGPKKELHKGATKAAAKAETAVAAAADGAAGVAGVAGPKGVRDAGKATAERLKRAKFNRQMMALGGAVGVAGLTAFNIDAIKETYADVWKTYAEPTKEDLLPPQALPPGQPPLRTLVVDLESVVNFEWDRAHGWRLYKRPGLSDFLEYLSQGGLYELVLFSDQQAHMVDMAAEKIDPMIYTSNGIKKNFHHMLFQDAALYRYGNWVKDLSCLNRELKDTILIDTDGDADWQLQPENIITLSKWDGDPDDCELLDLIPILESMVIPVPGITDVRAYIKQLKESDKPLAERHRELMCEKRQRVKEKMQSGVSGRSVFGGAGGRGELAILVPPRELESGMTSTPALQPDLIERERLDAYFSDSDLAEKQLEMNMDMQRKEMEEAAKASTIPIKIPKMPGSLDDISNLLNTDRNDAPLLPPELEPKAGASGGAAAAGGGEAAAGDGRGPAKPRGFLSRSATGLGPMSKEDIELAKARKEAKDRSKVYVA